MTKAPRHSIYKPTVNLPVDRSKPRAKAPGAAGKVRLLTIGQLDQRTLAAKRVHQLIAELGRDLTGTDDASQMATGVRQLVQRASILGAMIESDESLWLTGENVDLSNYFAALNTQRRILVTLGLDRRARDVTPAAPTLSEIAAEINAAHAAGDDDGAMQRIDAAAQRANAEEDATS